MKRAIVLPLLIAMAGAGAWATWGGLPAPSPPPQTRSLQSAALVRPIVVELFTSQGCSSCPPADAALAELARDPHVVAISRPVTYWDTPGWHDTLARPANTALQRAYAARQHSDEVYTPQAVVQGTVLLVGGRTGAIHRAIDEATARGGPRLRIESAAGGARLLLLEGASPGPAEIHLLALRGHVPVAIGRGENGGHTVDYVNVVVDEAVIGAWGGGPRRLSIAPARLRAPGADRYAIVVQLPGAGPILAAGYL